MSNKSIGTSFERTFADILAQNWFWVHLFQDNRNGQPCDVIAARNGHTYLFDCKNCEKDYFLLSRVEENQYNAMHLFELTGNSRGKFAIRFPSQKTYLIEYWQLKVLGDSGIKRISEEECMARGTELWEWLKDRDRVDGWSDKDADNNRQ